MWSVATGVLRLFSVAALAHQTTRHLSSITSVVCFFNLYYFTRFWIITWRGWSGGGGDGAVEAMEVAMEVAIEAV
jgi:hypothetical protein